MMYRCFTLITLVCLGTLWVGADLVSACPASYVKSKASEALRSSLGDKIEKITDLYLTTKGVEPTSNQGEFIKPYVVGTTWVDHNWGLRGYRHSYAHRADNKSVSECVQDALNCSHHTQHFGDAKRMAPAWKPSRATRHGG